MIVLDEQLLGRGIEHDIARWYRGKVQFITELRPHTVIKDDAIPTLLRQQPQPRASKNGQKGSIFSPRMWTSSRGSHSGLGPDSLSWCMAT